MEFNQSIRNVLFQEEPDEDPSIRVFQETRLPINFFEKGEDLCRQLVELLGMNNVRNHKDLKRTPARMFSALVDMIDPKEFVFTMTEDGYSDELVFMDKIAFSSLCEHHILPFSGFATVAYVPNTLVAGLSKIPRAVQFFSKNFTTQEKLTRTIAEFLEDTLKPRGVAVILEARHSCMELRGVESIGTTTRTSDIRGVFLDPNSWRDELFSLTNNRR